MRSLYTLPNIFQILLILAASAGALFQVVSIASFNRRLRRQRSDRWSQALEAAVLLQSLTLVQLLSEIRYYTQFGLALEGGARLQRWLLAAVLLFLAAVTARRRGSLKGLWVPGAAALTLPPLERLPHTAFFACVLLAILFWLVRSTDRFLRLFREDREQLSALSVKEAIDMMDTGLLFCEQNGQILLQNSRMQSLMATLTGGLPYDGRRFYRDLLAGRVLPPSEKADLGEQLAFRLPDGRIWTFSLHDMEEGTYFLMVASDNTESWNAAQELREKGRELERRNQELSQVLANLEDICAAEAAIHAKSRVHDVLGQQISLLLRALREHKEPDEALLDRFAQGLPGELYKVATSGGYSLQQLTEVFRGLGVSVLVEGSLPPDGERSQALYEIAMEAVTNAVRHGGATEIRIALREEKGVCRMTVRDNGMGSGDTVTEGGGLRGMRERTSRLGGAFAYNTRGGFHIVVELPEGGEL